MRKFINGLIPVFVIIVLAFAVLLAWRPDLARILRYQNPDMETYKIFPQSVVRPADTAFHFVRGLRNRDDLDTLKVLDGKKRLVPFKEYFDEGKLRVFLVIRNDSLIYEKCAAGYSDTTLTTTFSIAKSMTSILVGKALAEGKISSLNDLLVRYVPELKSNPAFSHITLMHLLSMKSGLQFAGIDGNYLAAVFSDEAKYYYTDDIKKELRTIKLADEPGTVWQYRSIDVFLLTWALENATGEKVPQYFQDKIWRKIGAEYAASWGLDKNGFANTASRFQCTAIDLAKIGRLFLRNGDYKGQQVLPEEWVNHSVRLNGEVPATAKYWQKTADHYLWWVPQLGVNGDFSAEGTKGQRLYVDPLTHTIIVEFALQGAGEFPYRKISRYLSGLPYAYPK
jgi:CubicO group peptidase (beta-lactamase class C family)